VIAVITGKGEKRGQANNVAHHYQTFKQLFSSKHEKRPKMIRGMDGIYSLKRLSEAL
jgi:hypothetical protein